MSKILVLGSLPPPMGSAEKIEASNYRTWQFVQPLVQDRHEIHLFAAPMGKPANTPDDWKNSLTYHPLNFREKGWWPTLQGAHDQIKPEAVVAVNYQSCQLATRIKTNAPIWMDIYGDQLTIMQMNFYRHANNRGLHTTIAFMRDILQKGDVFSGCGAPQEHMLAGQLAMAGRLNSRTMGYAFTRVVLPGAPPTGPLPDRSHRPNMEALGIDSDGFVVLWCGGYNAWTDVDTLFAALERAMASDPRVHYVSIGESTYPSPDNVYNQLKAKIAGSPHRDRYHLLGWLPWSALGRYYEQSSVGMNIDGLHYETIYGTRTRLLEMMAKGLPVVTSEGTELSYLLRDKGLALTFPSGDWQMFGDHLIQLSADRARLRAMSDCAYRAAQGEFSFYETTSAVRSWVEAPKQAPDHLAVSSKEQRQELNFRFRAYLRGLLWRFFHKA